MTSAWTVFDCTLCIAQKSAPIRHTLTVVRTFPADVDECHRIDARLRLACGGLHVTHVRADDLGEAEAGAEGDAEGEVVAGVGGGYGEQGGLLGSGEGLGGERWHGTS